MLSLDRLRHLFRALLIANIVLPVLSLLLALVGGMLAEGRLNSRGITLESSEVENTVSMMSCGMAVLLLPAPRRGLDRSLSALVVVTVALCRHDGGGHGRVGGVRVGELFV